MPDASAPSTKYFIAASDERGWSRVQRDQRVQRQRHQLEAEVERQEVGRR